MIHFKSFSLKSIEDSEIEKFLNSVILIETFTADDKLIYTYRDKSDVGPNKQFLLNKLGKRLSDAVEAYVNQITSMGQHDREMAAFEGSDDGKHKMEEQKKQMVKDHQDLQNMIDEIITMMEKIHSGEYAIPAAKLD